MDTIITPAHLPNEGCIRVDVSEDMRGHLLTVLRALKPKADIQAFDGTVMPGDLLVTTEPECKVDSASILPVPVGDPWGWWEWSKRAVEGPGLKKALAEALPLPVCAEGTMFGAELHFPGLQMNKASAALEQRIEWVCRNLADTESRRCFETVLFGGFEELRQHYHQRLFDCPQYTDHVRFSDGDVIINGGVHEGAEIPLFLALGGPDTSLHNIDPGGYKCLSDYAGRWLSSWGDQSQECAFALSDKPGRKELAVCDDGQMSSRFEKGDGLTDKLKFFPALSLEGYVKSRNLEKIDFIKLDLEGDEETVVPSLPDLANRFRPQMAISIYHKISHFWDIPKFLMDRLENYRFHVGHYSSQGYETILYAIPEERG